MWSATHEWPSILPIDSEATVSAWTAFLFAVRMSLRLAACEPISCCHSAPAVAETSPRTFSGSIGSRHAQAANLDLRSSTATRCSAVPGTGTLSGNPPELRKMRALSAPVGSTSSPSGDCRRPAVRAVGSSPAGRIGVAAVQRLPHGLDRRDGFHVGLRSRVLVEVVDGLPEQVGDPRREAGLRVEVLAVVAAGPGRPPEVGDGTEAARRLEPDICQLSWSASSRFSSAHAASRSDVYAVASGESCQRLPLASSRSRSGLWLSPSFAVAAMAGPPSRSTSFIRHWSCRSYSAAVSSYQS